MNNDRQSPLRTGMSNLTQPGGEYPKMLYRKTDKEEHYVQTTHPDGEPKTWLVINRFHGLLCETVVAGSLDDAETLAADGWDSSPEAAHGIVRGIAAATSAKDDEIAALKAEIARREARDVELAPSTTPAGERVEMKRGPGRPPRVATAE